MNRVFRLTTLCTWPLALATKKGCVHWGLYGVTGLCTEVDAETGEIKVQKKAVTFFDKTAVSDPLAREMLQAFNLNLADVDLLSNRGNTGLSAQEMCELMKASCRLMSSIGVFLWSIKYDVYWRNYFKASLYVDPVEDIGKLVTIDKNFNQSMPIPNGSSGFIDAIANFDITYHHEEDNAPDMSILGIGLTKEPGYYGKTTMEEITPKNLYEHCVTAFKNNNFMLVTEVPEGGWCRTKCAFHGLNESYSTNNALLTGKEILVAYTKPYPCCKANGTKGAKEGYGKGVDLRYSRGLAVVCSKENGVNTVGTVDDNNLSRNYNGNMLLDSVYAIPFGYDGRYLAKAFTKVPRVADLQRMMLPYDRYRRVDKDGSLSRTDVASILCKILDNLQSDAYIKKLANRGFITDSDVEKILTDYALKAIQAERKTDAEIEAAVELCKAAALLSEDGVVVSSTTGRAVEDGGVTYEFYPFTTVTGKEGCYPKLKSISKEVVESGAIISIPSMGEIAGRKKKLPVTAITPEFCDNVWRDVIRGIVVPATVTQIEGGAFSEFGKLELLDMSACVGLKHIGEGAIRDCSHLHDIKMPDMDAKTGYTLHTKALCNLQSLASLKIRAYDLCNSALFNVNVYSLDLDAVLVKSNAVSKCTVEGDLTLGSSFKEISSSGLCGLCANKAIDVKLPDILSLEEKALFRGDDGRGGSLELGANLGVLGRSAVYGWDSVIIHSKGEAVKRKSGVASESLRSVGAVKVHANSPFDVEALKSIPMDKVEYFEGEDISDYRKEAEAYITVSSAFLAEEGATLPQYLQRANDTLMDAICMEPELPSLVSIIGSQSAITGALKSYFAPNVDNGAYKFDDTLTERPLVGDSVMWTDIAVLRSLMAITKTIPTNLLNVYSNADLYAQCCMRELIHCSDNMIIERFIYVTADFRTNVCMYGVTLKDNGNTYLLVESCADRRMVSKREICSFLRMKEDGIEQMRYKEVAGFPLMSGEDDAGESDTAAITDLASLNAPFLIPGDSLRADSPTLVGTNMSGLNSVFEKYIKSILATSVVIRTDEEFMIYHPFTKWKVTFDNKADVIRVRTRNTSVSLSTFCKELLERKGKASRIVTDTVAFQTFAAQAIHPVSTRSTNFEKVLNAYAENKEAVKGKTALPLSKNLFDVITQYGSYIMSPHAGTGSLASENNLTVSKETAQRLLLADGLYLQCFVASRISKGKRIKEADLSDAERVAYRGGKNQYWYRLFTQAKGGEPTATYISSYDVKGLISHLKSFDFSKADTAPDIEYGKLVDKKRFIFDTNTMPTFFERLEYYREDGVGGARYRSNVGCALDSYTGRWYLVSNDLAGKDKAAKEKENAKDVKVSDKVYVLFPVSNIAFASAVVIGLTSTDITSTREYLVNLLDGLRVGAHSAVVQKYKEACSELAKDDSETSTDRPNRKRIMELTDFFLAPCLG